MNALTGISGLGGLIGGSAADVAAPTLVSAEVDSSGLFWTLTFTETVLGADGFSAEGDAPVALSYLSGEGSNVLVYEGDAPVLPTETLTLDYSPGDVEDVPGNALEAFSGVSVGNGSSFGISDPKTQPRFGLAGRRAGSFAGRTEGDSQEAAEQGAGVTQPRFGLSGRRCGSFAGR